MAAPVLLLGVPAGTSLALDVGPTAGETSSDRFRGFANVPFGLHLLRMGDTEAQWFAHSALLPLKYVVQGGGGFVADDEFRDNYVAAFSRGEFSTALVPYKDDAWPALSRFITLDVLRRCDVRLNAWVEPAKARFASTRRLELLKAVAPRDRFVQGFAHMLRVFYAGARDNFLGELQLAFVLFLGASSLDALQAWTGALRLAADAGPPLVLAAANDVVDVLTAQLRAFPQALLDEAETPALARALRRMVGHAADAGAETRACEALRERIGALFGAGGLGEQDDASDDAAAVVAAEGRPLRVEALESDDEPAARQERMAWML